MSYCSRYGGILCFHSFKSKRQRISTTTYKPKMKMSVSILKALQVRERTGSSLHDSVTKDRGCLSIIYEVAQEAPISFSIASNHFSIVSIQLMHFGQGLRASLQGGYAQNRWTLRGREPWIIFSIVHVIIVILILFFAQRYQTLLCPGPIGLVDDQQATSYLLCVFPERNKLLEFLPSLGRRCSGCRERL